MDMEAEDEMWKNIYKNLQKQKSENHSEHELRIQQIDGGFFEKFGSLFREQAEHKDQLEKDEQQKVAEAAANAENDDVSIQSAPSEGAATDSEEEEGDADKQPEDFISIALNIDELYTEILYEILHNVGCDVSFEIGQTALIGYAQDVFKMPNDKHQELMQQAEKKEATEILLNVEIIEAKELRAKDSNGLSDPFVTLFLNSNPSHRYNTSVKAETLSPTWQEHFSLPISENINEDSLNLEVWDFDPAESVKEKFGKFFNVKGVKGVRKLLKEITIAAATGQHENELIGTAKIPLKTIPATGMTMWYSLDKKHKVNRQGVIKIRISFSSEKNSQVAEQEHRHLIKLVLLHELETSKVAPHWWSGSFSPQAEALLAQHIAQSGLSLVEVALCQWSVYATIHQSHPLSFSLFSTLLDKLVKPLQMMGIVCEEDMKIFWDSTKKLLPSCFSAIRKIRKKDFKDKLMIKQIREVLNILSKLKSLDPLPEIDLFPSKFYPWLQGDVPNRDITMTVHSAVRQGALDWFNHVIENNTKNDDGPNGTLQYLIKTVQLVRSDLQKAIEFYDKHFQESINFQYAKIIYIVYQEQIAKLAEPDIRDICKSLKKLSFTGFSIAEQNANQPLAEGTILFEVYLTLFRFAELGRGLCPVDFDSFQIRDFHLWFHNGVAHWLDIALYKAMQRIEKAVELDELKSVETSVKYSSSAVDTLTIFYQVKVFWQQLNWPDVEGCYTFIAKIIDDICRSCIFYGERMAIKVDLMKSSEDDEKKFEVTEEWCLAINNIEYVKQALQPFTDELGIEDVIAKLAELKSPMEAARCHETLKCVTRNAIDTIHNKIIDLLETVVQKMMPAMKRLLIEGAELFNQDSNSIDRLMMYVDNNLQTLHTELNEENFDKTLEIVWDVLGKILREIIESNIEKRRPPSFFENLSKTLNLMLGSFKNPDESSNCDFLQRTEKLLKIHGLETADLIHQVHLDLFQQFLAEKGESPFGELTVRAKFEDNNLKIEVMNGRSLKAMDSNGLCDSFVRIHLLPEHKFTSISKPKTQTHYKNLFPLFDETFVLNLTEAQRNVENAMILFSVKDKDLLGYNNQYIGEAFIRFSDIMETDKSISSLPQKILPLWRPATLAFDSIRALEHRQGDKLAKDFLKRFKQRMGAQ